MRLIYLNVCINYIYKCNQYNKNLSCMCSVSNGNTITKIEFEGREHISIQDYVLYYIFPKLHP